jgi:hypothetical protein
LFFESKASPGDIPVTTSGAVVISSWCGIATLDADVGLLDFRDDHDVSTCTASASEPGQSLTRPAGTEDSYLIDGPITLAWNSRSIVTEQGITALSAEMPGPAPIVSFRASAIPAIAVSARAKEVAALAYSRAGNDFAGGTQIFGHYAKLPLSFEANYGQTDGRVDFLARAGGYSVFLTPTTAVFSIRGSTENPKSGIQNSEVRARTLANRTSEHVPDSSGGVAVHMQLVGGNADAEPVAFEQLPGKVNYFIGNDSAQWHSNIPTYAKVGYLDVYPGIDVVYYGRDNQLEYDFIVSPGADPSAITLSFVGANGIEIGGQGDLVLHTAVGDLIQQKPYIYQQVDEVRREVAGEFAPPFKSTTAESSIGGDHATQQIGFSIGAYDPSLPLIIDPLLLRYSTYLGGVGDTDRAFTVAADDAGHAYVAGQTWAVNFPATPGAFDTTHNGDSDVFVAKLNSTGSALVYATFLGGPNSDGTDGVAIDADGNGYVNGYTFLSGFPTTPGAFDTTFNGGGFDAFVAKLSPDGAELVYSTYLGGSGSDVAAADAAVDADGNAYVSGYSLSADFPVTPGAFDTTYNGGSEPGYGDVFVTKLNAEGSALVYSTFVGGDGDEFAYGLTIDTAGNAYATGYVNSLNLPTTPGAFDRTYNGGPWDGFVAKLNAEGSALVYSTYLGGHDWDSTVAIAVGADGSAYVTGMNTSLDFPDTAVAFDRRHNGHYDAFVTRLSPDGSTLVYSTFLGGNYWDVGAGVAVDGNGNAYVTGYTASANFPTTPDGFDTTLFGNGATDVFMVQLNRDGSTLRYSTFLGDSGWDYGAAIAVDASRNVYVTGETGSREFPTTPDAFKRRNPPGYDAFVVKFHSR